MNYLNRIQLTLILCLSGATIASADIFTVTNIDDKGAGSLREIIMEANGHVGLDTIAFNIPGSGVHTITPLSQLPAITDPVIIDGYLQPGAIQNSDPNGFNGTLLIELNGSSAGPEANGLTITG